jgi:hypothetical protein
MCVTDNIPEDYWPLYGQCRENEDKIRAYQCLLVNAGEERFVDLLVHLRDHFVEPPYWMPPPPGIFPPTEKLEDILKYQEVALPLYEARTLLYALNMRATAGK